MWRVKDKLGRHLVEFDEDPIRNSRWIKCRLCARQFEDRCKAHEIAHHFDAKVFRVREKSRVDWKRATLSEKVVELVRESGTGLTCTEIHEILLGVDPDANRTSIYPTVYRLVDAGRLIKSGKRYCVPRVASPAVDDRHCNAGPGKKP